MQNHQGSIHVSGAAPARQKGEPKIDALAFNENQLAAEEESKELSSRKKTEAEESTSMRQKLKFKCPICLNRQFISKCKLDWHLKCH